MKIKAMLFDVDGVLLNGRLEKDYGISEEIVQPFFLGPFPAALSGEADLKEIISPYLKQWGWQGNVDEFLDYWFQAEHIIDEALVEYIQRLRAQGIKCYLATNQERYRTTYILEKIGFKDFFDGIFVSNELGVRKPDVSFFAKAYEVLLPVEKEAVLFWDDLVENIEAAQSFGIAAETYTDFQDFKQKMKTYV
jgi:putative hydrolase of the HAD superfamily